jgi:hypothetical protein
MKPPFEVGATVECIEGNPTIATGTIGVVKECIYDGQWMVRIEGNAYGYYWYRFKKLQRIKRNLPAWF